MALHISRSVDLSTLYTLFCDRSFVPSTCPATLPHHNAANRAARGGSRAQRRAVRRAVVSRAPRCFSRTFFADETWAHALSAATASRSERVRTDAPARWLPRSCSPAPAPAGASRRVRRLCMLSAAQNKCERDVGRVRTPFDSFFCANPEK